LLRNGIRVERKRGKQKNEDFQHYFIRVKVHLANYFSGRM
jgi:hypothetical protein